MPGQQNPWDIPPFPTIGDMEEDTVYASVGRALSSWELFECRLSRIFSGLTGRINGTSPAMRAYGAVLTFRGRAEMIEAASEVYFLENPHQTLPGDLKAILKRARKYSPRRNEIAHGIVQRATITSDTRYGYCLFPPEYASNIMNIAPLHALSIETGLTARYIYSSVEINHFGERFRTELTPKAEAILHEIVRTTLQRYDIRRRRNKPEETP